MEGGVRKRKNLLKRRTFSLSNLTDSWQENDRVEVKDTLLQVASSLQHITAIPTQLLMKGSSFVAQETDGEPVARRVWANRSGCRLDSNPALRE